MRGHDAVYIFNLLVAGALVVFLPVSSSAAVEEATNSTTTTIITSQRTSSQNGTSIIIDNSDPAENDTLSRIKDRIDVQKRIDDLIASVTNNTGGRIADMRLSGNIASAHFNLNSGQVEQTFFGNWSLQVRSINNASFEADFDGTGGMHYRIDNFAMNSFQLVNDHVALGGTANVSESSQNQTWANASVSIVIVNGRGLSISFGEPELDEAFSSQPVYGVVSS
ncbi:MAG: hypothetical protein AB1351_05230 [Thermoproteota archaeon]